MRIPGRAVLAPELRKPSGSSARGATVATRTTMARMLGGMPPPPSAQELGPYMAHELKRLKVAAIREGLLGQAPLGALTLDELLTRLEAGRRALAGEGGAERSWLQAAAATTALAIRAAKDTLPEPAQIALARWLEEPYAEEGDPKSHASGVEAP